MNELAAVTIPRPSQNTIFKDSFSEEVWRNTYKDYKDDSVNDTFWRVAQAIASVEETPELRKEWSEKFYDMMSNFKVVPGGRIIANAGTEFKGTSLINCTVGPNPKYDADSLNGILEMLRNQAISLKAECGFGNNFCFKFSEKMFVKRNNEIIFIPIGEVVSGDYVLSYDTEWHLVEEILHSEKKNLLDLTLGDGKVITCTEDHPFLVMRNGLEEWILAKDILETDDLVTL